MAPSTKRRRTTGPAAAAAAKDTSSQSTLSFRGSAAKLTKSGAAPAGKPLSTPTKKPLPVDEPAAPTTIDLPPDVETTPAAAASPPKPKPKPAAPDPRAATRARALALPQAAIAKYWTAKEKARTAPRVHQASLGLHEKILREFDLTSRFGPCVGVAREERWWRAEGLGLGPPVEVLAVLLKEEESKGKGGKRVSRRSVVDRLMEGGKEA